MFFSSAGRTALDSIKYLHLKVCLTNIEKNYIFFFNQILSNPSDWNCKSLVTYL